MNQANRWNWMTEDEREEAEERAAIMQYHGNATREQAEFWAICLVYKWREKHLQQTRREQRRAEHQQAIMFGR